MATPDKPELDFSYSGFQQSQGDNSFPGTQLDNDLLNLKTAIDETIDFTAAVIRSDGKLQNGVVSKASLGTDVLAGVAPPSPWATDETYVKDVTVCRGIGLYLCLVTHVADDFDVDLAAGYWALLAEFTVPVEPADGSITEDKLAPSSVTTIKIADLAVTAAKIAAGAVTRAKIAANAGLMPIGAVVEFAGVVPPAGWQFLTAQLLSRFVYSELFYSLCPAGFGNITNGSPTITAYSNDLRFYGLIGAPIEGPGIPPGTTVTAITANSIGMSASATATTVAGVIVIGPHGLGDGSTTFQLPDARDYVSIARGDMGGAAAGRILTTGAGSPGLDTTKLGAVGGVDRHTLLTAQLPIVTPAGSVTITNQGVNPTATAKTGIGSESAPQNSETWRGSAGVEANSGIAASFAGTPFGSGQAHPNLQPSRVTNMIIFTGVV